MDLLFWRKKKEPSLSLETLAWNLMFTATDPDKAWEVASGFRKTSVPSSVVTCETTFLLGSISRNIIRTAVSSNTSERAIIAAEESYAKVFLDASEEDVPPEMQSIYGDTPLSEIAAKALGGYGREGDILAVTLPILVRRIRGDPRMAFEIKPLIEEREKVLRTAFTDLLANVR